MKKILTLTIIHKGNQVLLGLKKQGFGMGKWNGFGGKVEQGETIEEAAKREVFEEAGISVSGITKLGVLEFSWKSNKTISPENFGAESNVLQVHIFKAIDFTGEPQESDEMKPQWFNVAEIPYEKMWVDDKYWLPFILENKPFEGHFVFDENDGIAEYELHERQSHSNS